MRVPARISPSHLLKTLKIFCVLCVFVVIFSPAPQVAAHGGAVWFDGEVGPYHAVVQTGATLDDRQVRLTVYITDPATQDPLAGLQVAVQGVVSGTVGTGADALALLVPAEAAQPGFYDSLLTLPRYGNWRITLTVRGAAGAATGAFLLPAQAPPGLDSPLWWIALLPVAVAGAVLFYFWRVLPPEPAGAPLEPTATVEPSEHPGGGQHQGSHQRPEHDRIIVGDEIDKVHAAEADDE